MGRVWNYLKAHPDAGDTLEGIIKWWLPRQELEKAAARIEEALNELVERNYLVAERHSDGQIHYRMHPDRKAEKDRGSKPENN